jgi:hypothetical protein
MSPFGANSQDHRTNQRTERLVHYEKQPAAILFPDRRQDPQRSRLTIWLDRIQHHRTWQERKDARRLVRLFRVKRHGR